MFERLYDFIMVYGRVTVGTYVYSVDNTTRSIVVTCRESQVNSYNKDTFSPDLSLVSRLCEYYVAHVKTSYVIDDKLQHMCAGMIDFMIDCDLNHFPSETNVVEYKHSYVSDSDLLIILNINSVSMYITRSAKGIVLYTAGDTGVFYNLHDIIMSAICCDVCYTAVFDTVADFLQKERRSIVLDSCTNMCNMVFEYVSSDTIRVQKPVLYNSLLHRNRLPDQRECYNLFVMYGMVRNTRNSSKNVYVRLVNVLDDYLKSIGRQSSRELISNTVNLFRNSNLEDVAEYLVEVLTSRM